MQQLQADPEEQLTAAARLRAAAEHVEWSTMLAYSDRLVVEYSAESSYFLRRAQLASIALEIANAMHLSEGQVHRRLSCAETIREQAPLVWSAFAAGTVDAYRVTMIADTIAKLVRPASIMTLDARVVAYAVSHTSVELKAWLKRFITRVEADLFNERAEAARADRHVSVEHGDNAMSWMNANLPSHMIAAVDKRLTFEAKKLPADGRTLAQKRTDLFVSWLTNNEFGELAVGADVAVVIPAETLAGCSAAPAVAADGSFIVPAAWITDPANHLFWHTILTDTGGNVLEHQYKGRFAPDTLKKGLAFKHGVCQAPTCTKPAHDCDDDHQEPFPQGPTSGTNMGPLCRRHHQMKSHGVLNFTLPSGKEVEIERADHRPSIDLVSPMEHRLMQFIARAA